MVIKQDNGTYYSTLGKKYYENGSEACFWDSFYNFEKFIGYDYYARDGESVYIQDEYLYKVWLIYLSLLQCTIHPNLINNYDVFTTKFSVIEDDYLDGQNSVPELFMKYKNDFKGPGWYKEESVFRPTDDLISVIYSEATENPLSEFAQWHISGGSHKHFGGWA